ncbi:MAG: hypothetical protein HYW26_02520 [Candidatus Aenigmarchaeota archaeon]|nr:hypothetical protein [Candidatus Aenigmarchaeota archaeon]
MKTQQICIVCGSPVFSSNYCEKCFLKSRSLFEVPEKILLRHCTSCGAYYDKGWVKNTLEKILESKVSSRNRISDMNIRVGNGKAEFSCSGYVKPSKKIKGEKKTVPLLIERGKCDSCIKLLSGYYQAIFQIRGDRMKKIIRKVSLLTGEGEAFSESDKDGCNVKFIDKRTAARIAGMLKNFQIKKSYKLITEKKGKKLYRDYYSIR